MKTIFVILIAGILSGCMYQRVDQNDIKRATAYCGSVENILQITSHSIGEITARCMDKETALIK